jgi:hypothetical protein
VHAGEQDGDGLGVGHDASRVRRRRARKRAQNCKSDDTPALEAEQTKHLDCRPFRTDVTRWQPAIKHL